MNNWRLIDYFDVWGNEIDGWEVNDAHIFKENLVFSDKSTDKKILRFLERVGFLNTSDMRRVRLVDYGDEWIEIEAVKYNKPLGRLERMR